MKDNGETKVSIVKFRPVRKDNGKTIRCVAENPQMKGSRVEDSIVLSVSCKSSFIKGYSFLQSHVFSDVPSLSLRLGPNLIMERIKEGDDVYFDCRIDANPPIKRLEWYLGVRIIQNFI